MTQEQKAQAYDKVREKIAIRFGSNVAEEIFSEYEESEDEKIRRDIVTYLKQSANSATLKVNAQKFNKWIAWLEKQGEQKQVIIAKFKIGDKVRLKGSCGWYNVAEIRGNAYYLTSHDVVPCLSPICEQDNWEVEQKPTNNDIKEELSTEYEKASTTTYQTKTE